MNILLVGDGPLARELAALFQSSHTVTALFLDEGGLEGTEEEGLGSLVDTATDLAVEAVLAEPTEKWDAITELDRVLPSTVPILTAALNASATEVASWCHHPARVVGFAALPPLSDATLIEFMPALQSSPEALVRAQEFWRGVGREPVAIRDSVGGVLPRVVCCLINEAAFALAEGIASAQDIDQAMQLGTSYPRGPVAWADQIRLDQVVGILEALGNEFGPDQYRPAPFLRQLARAGRSLSEGAASAPP